MPNQTTPNQTTPNHERTEDGHESRATSMNRRTMVAGTGMIAAAAAIVGCSSYGSSDVGGATPATPPTTGEKGNASEGAKTGGTPETGQGEALGSAASIPVGGGVVYTSQQLVVTQPEPGTYRAFSAICTHKQCTVGTVADGTINCPCHGSKFAVADGSVVRGPAKKPLPAREVTVEGNTIRVV